MIIIKNTVEMYKTALLLNILIIFSISVLCQYRIPEKYTPSREFTDQSLFEIVDMDEQNVDVGFWALIIGKEFYSTLDVAKYLKLLDEAAEEIKRMLAGRNKDMDKFLAVKTFLYEPGKWNNFTLFSYNLDDPLGHQLENQLLSTYLKTKKGNCVSMPTLFLSLMERVDLTMQFVGVKAPLHLLCRFKDRQTGDVWNVEATNGGNPARNHWYIETMNINQTAIEQGTYLKDLTKKEYIAELMTILIAKERRNGNYKKALKYTELVLKLNPNSVLGLVNKGALLAEIGKQKLDNGSLTYDERIYYEEESAKYIERARTFGWKPQAEEEREEYLKRVNEEKQKKLMGKK